MTREQATNYRARLVRILWDEGIESVIELVPTSVIKKIAICKDFRKYGGGRTTQLHGVSRQYVSKICGCKNEGDYEE